MSRAIVLRASDGRVLESSARHWHDPASAAERQLVARLPAPIIDIGCGPARMVLACQQQRITALGVDSAPGAVRLARAKGAAVLSRSVFDEIPGEGRWGSALLLDGSVGIGGDPVRLLARVAAIVRIGGTVAIEVAGDGGTWRGRARIERRRQATHWFPWATIGTRGLELIAGAIGLEPAGNIALGRRPVALLHRTRLTSCSSVA